jgi:hypothetical protein
MKTKLTIVPLLFIVCALSGYANPIDPTNEFKAHFMPLMALACEAAVVAAFLSRRKFSFVRTLCAWFMITFGTYCFLTGGRLVFDRFNMDLARTFSQTDIGDIWKVLTVATLVGLELFVVLIEAYVIMRLAASRFFRDSNGPFTWKQALVVSIVGNLISFTAGLILPMLEPV